MATLEVSLNMSIPNPDINLELFPLKDLGGNLHNSDTDKAQLLNHHFATVFVQDDGNISPFSRDEADFLPKDCSVFPILVMFYKF